MSKVAKHLTGHLVHCKNAECVNSCVCLHYDLRLQEYIVEVQLKHIYIFVSVD